MARCNRAAHIPWRTRAPGEDLVGPRITACISHGPAGFAMARTNFRHGLVLSSTAAEKKVFSSPIIGAVRSCVLDGGDDL